MSSFEKNGQFGSGDAPSEVVGIGSGVFALEGLPAFSMGVAGEVSNLLSDSGSEKLEYKKMISDLENRLRGVTSLSDNVDFEELRKSLCANPELLDKIIFFDAKGHFMNYFDQNESSFIFVSSWTDVKNVDKAHRYLVYDAQAYSKLSFVIKSFCKGNVLDIVSISGVELFTEEDQRRFNMFYKSKGRSWLQTPSFLRENEEALMGRDDGVLDVPVDCCLDFASFRVKVVVPRVLRDRGLKNCVKSVAH
ncbi:MAG: DUF4256 domain-containing protein [Candidatus Gracilibacteria bacterium]|nr:DUF4256 domain-containing protein [Candidatus Gracilibacteria bacterium]